MRIAKKYPIIFLAAAGALLFIPFIGRLNLFDWDEINFAECAREMIVSGDYLNVQIHFRPFWEKPPLFIWMQVLSMKAFGINEFAARFPNAVCGIVTLITLYQTGKKISGQNFGLWWAFLYAASILPHLYFRSGIIDPWFNLFIFLSLYQFYLYSAESESRSRRIAASGIFAGLAILTKGPTAVLILALVVSAVYISRLVTGSGKWNGLLYPQWKHFIIFLALVSLTGGSWFLLQILNGNGAMVQKFILYQVRLFTQPDAGHGGHWSYHFWVLLFGVFPASVFAIRSFIISRNDEFRMILFHRFMLILFWVVLILFSIVKTKIVHYSSLCYIPLTFMAARTIKGLLASEYRWKKWQSLLLLISAILFGIIALTVPMVETFKQQIIDSGMIRDDFAIANLKAEVTWTGFEELTGILLITGIMIALFVMRKRLKTGIILVMITTLVFTWAAIIIYPFRIEQYSQRAVIDFYKSKAGENCYILNSGFFTYAPDFYASRMPGDFPSPMWLLSGNIDRPFYLVLKEPHYRQWRHLVPAMNKVYDKNGWVVLVRNP